MSIVFFYLPKINRLQEERDELKKERFSLPEEFRGNVNGLESDKLENETVCLQLRADS